MRKSRVTFKLALKWCRQKDLKHNSQAMDKRLANKDTRICCTGCFKKRYTEQKCYNFRRNCRRKENFSAYFIWTFNLKSVKKVFIFSIKRKYFVYEQTNSTVPGCDHETSSAAATTDHHWDDVKSFIPQKNVLLNSEKSLMLWLASLQ